APRGLGIVEPGERRRDGRKADRARQQQNGVVDLVVRWAGLARSARVAMHGALRVHGRRRGELDQLGDFRLERSGRLDALAELLDGLEVLGIALRELVEVFRFSHGTLSLVLRRRGRASPTLPSRDESRP